MSKYKLTVGLEIHAELNTKTKMFCDSLNDPDEKHPNINVCPVCMGHPGTLPVANKKAIESVLRVGFALGGKIPEYSRFDRKNYFYPDLPKGYQISQYQHPFVSGGRLNLPGMNKSVNITRVHLEEDTGRLLHESENSLVDFNRAGVPLMELVTEPEISSGEEAMAFAEEFQLLLRYLGVSDANMEKGQMRVEANISIAIFPPIRGDDAKLGTKVEIKNLNSFKIVEKAINYEYKRQKKVLEGGKKVIQETRGWDEDKQKTYSQRLKEESHDYRYFPEPDIPPLDLTDKDEFDLDALEASLPELPWQKRERFQQEYNLKDGALLMVVRDEDMASFLENTISELLEWTKGLVLEGEKGQTLNKESLIKLAVNYITSDLRALVKEKDGIFSELLITPENFAELIKMTAGGEISSRVAKDVMREMFSAGGDPSDIVDKKGLKQVGDESELGEIAKRIVEKNPGPVADYKKGKESALQFFVGQGMRASKGSANPAILKKLFTELLNK